MVNFDLFPCCERQQEAFTSKKITQKSLPKKVYPKKSPRIVVDAGACALLFSYPQQTPHRIIMVRFIVVLIIDRERIMLGKTI